MEPRRIIFLSLVQIDSLQDRGIYHDLLREFASQGHKVTVVCPVERRTGLVTSIFKESGATILQVRTLNVQKSSLWEKGLATITLNFLLQSAIKKHLKGVSFDLVLYATPPITITKLIQWLKYVHRAKSYLLLKDIFPQNAVDMRMFRANSLIHKYFIRQEQELYALSDRIGCMSPANVNYIIKHHPEMNGKIEVNPNSLDLTKVKREEEVQRVEVLAKWKIPTDAVIFLYGGNLGKPQGTDFLLKLINNRARYPKAYFLIVGDGTDYNKLKEWFDANTPINGRLIQRLPKRDFDELAACCDVGLIMLRKEFTIPNFPSRLLTYLENRMPVLAITDEVSDLGRIAEAEGFGKWCIYGEEENASKYIGYFESEDQARIEMGRKGFVFMQTAYDVKQSYNKIIDFVQESN